MTSKTQYVLNTDEATLVDQTRANYVNTYAPWLIKAAKIKPKSILLDAACGTGAFAKQLSKIDRTIKFILLDINPVMVRLAKKRLGNRCFAAIACDAAKLRNVVQERVDTILCLNAFHIYIGRKVDFLKCCAKILKSGDRLVFDVSTRSLDPQSNQLITAHNRALQDFARVLGKKATMNAMLDKKRLQAYERMVRECGFIIEHKTEFRRTWTIDEFYKDNICIPGRSRHVFPDMNYRQRMAAFRYAAKVMAKKIPGATIKQSRIFFITKKI